MEIRDTSVSDWVQRSTDEEVANWFRLYTNKDTISTEQIRDAFKNSGLWVSGRCASLMVRMMSSPDPTGELNLRQFTDLYYFVHTLRTSFIQVDSRGDKKLRINDVAIVLEVNGIHMSTDVLSLMFKSFDTRARGYLTLPEYVELAMFVTSAHRLFKDLDRNQNNEITLDQSGMILLAAKLR